MESIEYKTKRNVTRKEKMWTESDYYVVRTNDDDREAFMMYR